MGAKFLKSHPYGCKVFEKGTFKRLFLAKFEFSVLTFVKVVKILPLWVQKSVNHTLIGAFRACKTTFL